MLEGEKAPSDAPAPDTTSTLEPVPLSDTAPPPAASSTTQYTPEEFYQDYNTALQVVNGYWANRWSDFFTGTYSPPQLITGSEFGTGMYLGGSDQILCGNGARAIFLGPQNAYYCGLPYDPDDDYLAFDVNFLWRARENGDMFVYMIVAHEWGHAIQARLDTALQRVEYELQADCLAGATLQGAVNDGTLVLEQGDIEEVSIGLSDIADEGPWGKPGDHGSPDQRIENFTTGADNGVLACLPQLQ
ncbi:hypothetical protein [Georgenia sp. AZ-5]|uniref:hypothetical protein n=1 Tax=Georgenia sp. AZ-5 TaxID=3367526 RepID=UPI0037549254